MPRNTHPSSTETKVLHFGFESALAGRAGCPRNLVFAVDCYLTNPTCRSRSMDVLRILLAIILPPVGVFLQVGLGLHFWLNILLTLLGYIPGIIHAVYIIVTRK